MFRDADPSCSVVRARLDVRGSARPTVERRQEENKPQEQRLQISGEEIEGRVPSTDIGSYE